MGEGRPARMDDGRIAARQIDGLEVADALVAAGIGEERLAAPDRAVVAVARAVEREAEHGALRVPAVLGHDRGDVGVVVLDFDDELAMVRSGPGRGAVAGVTVGGDHLRGDGGVLLELIDTAFEGLDRLEVLHVPQVLAHPGVRGRCQADRVLQFATHRQDVASGRAHRNRQGSEAPGAPDGQDGLAHDPNDRVVTRDVDRPVVGEPGVAQMVEPLRGGGVVERDRLAVDVATRHDQRWSAGVEEQVVDRRGRQHDAEQRTARSDRLSDGVVTRFVRPEQHDGPGRRLELRCLGVIDDGDPA